MLAIRLLGIFSATLDGATIEGLGSARLQGLLTYLLLHRSSPVARGTLAAALWPETNDEQSLTNLRTLLTRLRQVLPDLERYVVLTPQTLHWRPDAPATLDVAVFEDALREAQRAPCVAAFARAVDLYAGDLVPGNLDEWLLDERARLRQAWLAGLEQLGVQCEQERRPRDARAAAQRLLRADPLHEPAYALLMRAQLALGDRAGALRTFHTCAALLRDELGVDPGAETQAVYARVLASDAVPALPNAPAAQAPRARVVAAVGPLIGRARSLAWLEERWQEAQTGNPQIALLVGEAGIGKTRLAEEMAAWVEKQGGDIAIARCYAGGGSVAYAPVVEWLHSKAVGARLRSINAVWRTEAARLVPELLAEQPALPAPEPMREAWQNHRFARGLAATFLGGLDGEAAHPVPLLLLLDDIQWADAETLEWLPTLLHLAAGTPMLVLATLRPEEVADQGPLATLRATLPRTGQFHERTLRALDEVETAALVAALTAHAQRVVGTALAPEWSAAQAPAAGAAAAQAAPRLYQDTEGNPLFIVETVRAGQEGTPARDEVRQERADTLGLPPKVLATLRYRLGQLSPPARSIAEQAAVLGRAFRYDLLAEASSQDDDALVVGLDELWRRQIVREQGADAYDFSHDKLRQVAYASLGSARRRLLHRRAAEALVARQGSETAVAPQIAHHFEQAGERRQAVIYYRRAAEAAQAVYAVPETIRLYRHILSNDLAPALVPDERCDLLLALGDALAMTGHGREAEEVFRAAAAEAIIPSDLVRLAKVNRGLGEALHLQGYFEQALTTLAQARAVFERAGNRKDLVRTLQRMGEVFATQDRVSLAQETFETQAMIAAEIGDRRGLADALNGQSELHWHQNDLATASALAQEALEIAEAIGYRPGALRALLLMGNAQEEDSDVIRWLLRAALVARELDDRPALYSALINIGYVLLDRGEFAPALAGFLQAAHSAAQAGLRHDASVSLMHAARALHWNQYLREAEMLYRIALRTAKEIGASTYLVAMQNLLADLLAEQGWPDEAATMLSEAHVTLAACGGPIQTNYDRRRHLAISSVRIRAAQGLLDAAAAYEELDMLLPGADWRQIGEIAYWQWRLNPSEEGRLIAAERLRDAHAHCGHARQRQRYLELMGVRLPEPQPLPDVSALISSPPDLDAVLVRVNALLPLLSSEPTPP